MILNHQNRIRLDLAGFRTYARRVKTVLDLGKRDFNVCFVDDEEISRLNLAHRGKNAPTDVLSFPWQGSDTELAAQREDSEFTNFLGDIVISVETARENACEEGHSTENEIRWLILHGVLHLLGYDHAQDNGEMTSLELALRERLCLVREGRFARRAEPALRLS